MSYTVTDEYHILKFRLITEIPTLSNSLYLYVFKQGNTSATTPDQIYTCYSFDTIDYGKYEYTFHVLSSDFDIGDVLNRFVMVHDDVNQTVPIWTTDEGVSIFVDGEFYKNIHENHFDLKFDNSEVHTVQAIYQGNNQNRMSYTPLKTYRVKQHDEDGGGGGKLTGKWSLKFNNPSVLKDLHYNDNKKIQFKLTRGGQAVGGKIVEIITPRGSIFTATTNSKGIVYLKNHDFNAGKYKFGAYMVDENLKKYASGYKTATIKKNDVDITHSSKKLYSKSKAYLKMKRVYIRLLNNRGNPMKNTKLTVYQNKQTKSLKTDKDGYIKIDCKTGTHNFKIVYAGSKNYNKKTEKFSVTVPKKG